MKDDDMKWLCLLGIAALACLAAPACVKNYRQPAGAAPEKQPASGVPERQYVIVVWERLSGGNIQIENSRYSMPWPLSWSTYTNTVSDIRRIHVLGADPIILNLIPYDPRK